MQLFIFTSSFLSTFIDGIAKMENGEIHEKLETTFAGKQHRWNVSLFHACNTQEQYELLPEQLRQTLGDATLANECYSFLPEMCTENAFPQMAYAESIQLVTGSDDTIVCCKNQLADYWSLHSALFSLFEEGAFGDAAEEIYKKYISVSASYGVVQQIYEKGGDDALSQGSLTALLYRVGDDFEIR